MQRTLLVRMIAVAALTLVANESLTRAQDRAPETPVIASDPARPLSLSLATAYTGDLGFRDSRSFFREGDNPNGSAKSHDYREISDFFNVREANVNTVAGEWEMELEGEWVTGTGGINNFEFTPNLKYGLNDDMFIEVEVLPLAIGDGGKQGNGNIALQLFNQFTRETETLPAFAAWIEARLPTGRDSSGVDAELHMNLTKTLVTDVRGHLEGFTRTANGRRGDDDGSRRAFQWGVGIGLDYQYDDLTIYTVNYLNSSSEEYGHSNHQILEIGGVREIAEDQHVKVAVDFGLDGGEETPDFGFKILWSFEW